MRLPRRDRCGGGRVPGTFPVRWPSRPGRRRAVPSRRQWCATSRESAAHGSPRAGTARRSGRAPGRPDNQGAPPARSPRSEEHTSELQSRENLVCRLLLEKKKKKKRTDYKKKKKNRKKKKKKRTQYD